jgi:predicted amidophosphoribosyltransferase
MAEYCPDCGETVEEGDRFCYYCGEGLASETPRTQTTETNSSCPDCGEHAYPADRYCYHCGEPLPSVASRPGGQKNTSQRQESRRHENASRGQGPANPTASDQSGSKRQPVQDGQPRDESSTDDSPTARHYSSERSGTDSADPFRPEQQCPECRKSMESDATFCYYCGTKFE